jgi:hypothetical protein
MDSLSFALCLEIQILRDILPSELKKKIFNPVQRIGPKTHWPSGLPLTASMTKGLWTLQKPPTSQKPAAATTLLQTGGPIQACPWHPACKSPSLTPHAGNLHHSEPASPQDPPTSASVWLCAP